MRSTPSAADSYRLPALVFLVALIALPPAPARAQVDEEPVAETPPLVSSRTETAIEEIVVRARKRDELLVDTPVSVTALSQETLREAGLTRIADIDTLVPNLSFYTLRTDEEALVQLRGIGPGPENGEPGVGIYVDGVYMARAAGSVLNVIDMEQVEVLRGPQGTLFGKNTVGGALNIRTVRPKDEFSGHTLLRAGNYDTVETRATLNAPIPLGSLDRKLLTRISFASANSDGYTKNTFRDERWSDRNSLWVLGALRYLPTDDIELNLSGNWFNAHTRGRGGECAVQQPPPDPATAALMSAFFPDYVSRCRQSRPFRFESEIRSIVDREDYGMWGDATWDLGAVGFLDELGLKAIGSWREQVFERREDIDMTRDPIVVISELDSDGRFDGSPFEARQFSFEGQANGNAFENRLHLVTGVFAYWETREQVLATRALANTVADLFNASTLGDIEQDDSDWALFGQATYDLTDWASLTGGIRYTEETKEISRLTVNPFGDTSNPGVPTTLLDSDEREVFQAWTPMASLAFRVPDERLDGTVVDHLMTYVSYSRGFKGGGFNATVGTANQTLDAYDPEFLDSYEVGLKTLAFDRKLSFNASLFYGDYEDIQVVTVRALPGPNPGDLPTLERVVLNAAEATTIGTELEVVARPVTGLQLTGAIGLLDATYDEFTGISALDGSPIDREDETFNYVPEFTSNVSVQYAFDVNGAGPSWLDGRLTPRIEWYYQSEVHFEGPELTTGVQGEYNLLNTRLSYEFFDDQAQVAMWAKNLLDEEYFTFAQTLANPFGTVTRYYAPPTTFGADVSYRF